MDELTRRHLARLGLPIPEGLGGMFKDRSAEVNAVANR
jgi:hypothetical protein